MKCWTLRKFFQSIALAAVIIQTPGLSPCSLAYVVGTSDMTSYRLDAIRKVLSCVQTIPDYSSATIRMSLNALGQPTKCEIKTSSGNKVTDEKILGALKACKFDPMNFASGIDDEMTLQIPLSHEIPSSKGFIAGTVGVGEAFVFNSPDSKIDIEGGGSQPVIAKREEVPYKPEDMQYDKEIELLYREGADSVLRFNTIYSSGKDMANSAAHLKSAEDALKQERRLQAANEYILASSGPFFHSNADEGKKFLDKAQVLSSQLDSRQKQSLVQSLINYAEGEGSSHSNDALYIAQLAKDISTRAFGENSRNTLALLKVFGTVYDQHNKYADAESTYKRMIALMIAQSKERRDIESAYAKLTNIYERQRKYLEMGSLQREYLEWLIKQYGGNGLEVIPPICRIARAEFSQDSTVKLDNRVAEILRVTTSYEPLESLGQPFNDQGVQASCYEMSALAQCLAPMDNATSDPTANPDQKVLAEKLLKASYELAIRANGADRSTNLLNTLCKFLSWRGKNQEALVLYEAALKAIEQSRSPKTDSFVFGAGGVKDLKNSYVQALRSAGRPDDADRLEAQAKSAAQVQADQRFEQLEKKVELMEQDENRDAGLYLEARLQLVLQLLERKAERATALYKECLSDVERNTGGTSERVSQQLFQCTDELARRPYTPEDYKLVTHSLEILELRAPKPAETSSPFRVGGVLQELMMSKLFQNREDETALFLRKVVALEQSKFGTDDALVASIPGKVQGSDIMTGAYYLTNKCAKLGKFDDARHFLDFAISTEMKRSGSDSANANAFRVLLAEVLVRAAQREPADPHRSALLEASQQNFDTAAGSYLKAEGSTSGNLATIVRRRALILTICGLTKEASELVAKYKQEKVTPATGNSLLIN